MGYLAERLLTWQKQSHFLSPDHSHSSPWRNAQSITYNLRKKIYTVSTFTPRCRQHQQGRAREQQTPETGGERETRSITVAISLQSLLQFWVTFSCIFYTNVVTKNSISAWTRNLTRTLLRDNLRAGMSIPVASKKHQKIEFFHTPGQIRIQDTFKNYHEVRHAKQLVS